MENLLFAFLVLIASAAAFVTKKLTLTATFIAAMVAVMIYSGTGYTGITLLGIFFLLGVTATSWKKELKQAKGFMPPEETGRDTGQVLANSGMAAMLSLAAIGLGDVHLMKVLVACCFSSAAADTVSSELGVIYGRRAVNILSMRPGKKGDNGIVSIEGTLLGISASVIISFVYAAFEGFHPYTLFTIVTAGTIGNIVDSVLGATLERRDLIGNNAVNFLNTLAAVSSGLLLLLLS